MVISKMGFIDGMNSSTSSTVQQQEADASWPSHESWEHPVGTAGTVVLDTRQILPQRSSCALNSRQDTHHSRLDWEWETPMLLTQHSATCSEDQESEDCKPNIMADHNLLVGSNLHQHNSLNPLSFHSNNLSHNSITWGLQSPSFCGETAMVDSSSSTFLAAAPGPFGQHAIGGMAIPGICGLSTGHNLGLGDPRSALEQQHRHLLELVHMDHQRRVQDNIVPDFATRLGLNLGGRTYFSAEDHLSSMMSFGKRHRPNSPGAQVPMCQAEGCKADLSFAKHYHRRHKVCEFHSKASNVIIGGQTQRFCQQCSRFHMLSEFDEGKRSCRKRLADHNRRRRKPQPAAAAASAATTTSTTTELTLPKSTDHNQDQNPRKDDRSSGSQTKAVAASIDSPSLLSTMSLAPTSVPLMLQNGKKQLHLLSGRHQEKEAYQKFVEGHSNSSTSSTHRQSSSHNHNGLEIGPWLKTIASKSPNTGISDSSSSNRQLLDSAGGSSTMQALSLRMQNLSALQPKSDHMDNPDWVKKNMSGQQMQTVREMETCNHPNLQEVIQKQQLQLPSNSSTNVNGASHGIDFQGLIGLRPYNNQSVYSNHE